MLKVFSILVLFYFYTLTFSTFLFAQVVTGTELHHLPQLNKRFVVLVHVLVNKDSVSNVDTSSFRSLIESVNGFFEPISASFYVCRFNTVYNFQYDLLNNDRRQELINKHHISNAINIFLVQNLYNTPVATCGMTDVGGVNQRTKNGIVLVKGNCLNRKTIAQALGSYFSLRNTSESSIAELVNGSNCLIAGDQLCDTPADPFNSGLQSNYINSNCLFISQQKDGSGDFYDPLVSNIMSFYSCPCNNFTRGQYEKMANYYRRNPVMW